MEFGNAVRNRKRKSSYILFEWHPALGRVERVLRHSYDDEDTGTTYMFGPYDDPTAEERSTTVRSVSMRFTEMAWGAFLYQMVGDYDRAYGKLFAQTDLIERLRQSPGTVSPREFRDSIITFLNEWGGRHIRKDEAIAEVFLRELSDLHHAVEPLLDKALIDVDLGDLGRQVQCVFDGLRQITWKNGTARRITLGRTFASKLAHVVNPSLFVMFDNRIWDDVTRANRGIRSYAQFMAWTQEQAQMVLSDFRTMNLDDDPAAFLSERLGCTPPKTLAKFLDECNWVRRKRQLDRLSPPRWLFCLEAPPHRTSSSA